jgi:DNA-binding MarR family transcriptional regulator
VAVSERVIEQYVELLQRFMRLRLDLMLPEHLVQFKQQIEKSRGNAGNLDDIFLFRLFAVLAQQDTPPTMGELSSELGVPLSTATRIVDWLVRADFVERVPDARDRRMVRVQMTASGQQFYHTGMEYNKQQIKQVLKNFTAAEQAELLRLMNKLLEALAGK